MKVLPNKQLKWAANKTGRRSYLSKGLKHGRLNKRSEGD